MRKTGSNSLPTVILLYWIALTAADQVTESFPQEFDFRFTSYEELIDGVAVFNHPDIVGYVQLRVDEDNDQILLGARDSLFRLSLDNLSPLEVTDAAADNNTVETCLLKGQLKEHCHNFIRVLLLHNDTNLERETGKAVFVCGTNAFQPQCSWRQASNLSNIIEDGIEGMGKAPHSPTHNSTALMTANGDFYGATVVDIKGQDPAIYRSMGIGAKLRTQQYDSKWLNEPDFVSAYEIGEFIYFFFREVAVEFINCGKRIYSRVARVCKTDRGGSLFLDTTWTSYFKSRLNCSIPGEYPFYFEEVQSTFYLENGDQKYVYAVFTTPVNSIAGSAVCVYNMTAFNTSFAGPFKYQEGPRSAWERHENSDPLLKCPEEKRDASKRSFEETEKEKKQIMITQKYQMMDLAVQPQTLMPLMHEMNERWTHVLVDSVKGKKGVYHVVFIATADGKIRKMLKLPTTGKTCLIEEIKIVPNGEPKPVKAMELSHESKAIFISTFNSVIKIPLERCSRFKNRDMCLNANDPYCGWNDYSKECTPAPQGQPEVHFWTQSMDSCPFVPHRVNGNWSLWSEWSQCSQVGNDPSVGDCLCRSRSCDNPKPYYGGDDCVGSSVEVTNCTAHGQWTEWAEWSSCSQSCGSTAIRSRHRYCSNPPPRFGGRDCVGIDTEEEYCRGHPPCPLPPVQGNWTEWTEWSECSAKCNGGIQTRRRSCKEPPAVKVIPCAGSTQEWRMCNTHICEELDKMTPWTPWVSLNHSKGGYFQERFRFHCKANVSSQSMMGVKTAQPQVRFCFDGGSCHDSDKSLLEDRDGQWSPWGLWSACNRQCDGGLRWRRRDCDNPPPLGHGVDCPGHSMEGQECNAHSCKGVWGCWSEMSECSVSCGMGVKARTRQCQSSPPGKPFTIPCDGEAEEITPCQAGPCITVALASKSSQGILEREQFNLAQMFLVGGLSFILGGSASLALYAYIHSFRMAMRDAKRREKLQKQEKVRQQQRTLERKLSRHSMKHQPSFSSQVSLDNFFTLRNKMYDVGAIMKDTDYNKEEIDVSSKQTVLTLMRRRIMRLLIWVCTVCQYPIYGTPGINGLRE